jgi:hypothetical protein
MNTSIKNEKAIRYALAEVKKSIHNDPMHLTLCESIVCSTINIKGLHEYDKKRSIILEAVSKIDIGQYTLDDFRSAIKQTIAERVERGKKSFKIIFFLHINKKQSKKLQPLFQKKWVNLCGQKLYFRDSSYLTNKINSKKFFNKCAEYEDHLSIKLDSSFNAFQPVEICVKSYSSREASYIAHKIFNLLRAFLNYCDNCFLFNQQFGVQKPLNSFLPSPLIGTFDGEGEFLTFDYQAEVYKYTVTGINRRFQDKMFFQLLSDFKTEPIEESLKELISDVFVRYGAALDHNNRANSFFELWQILESVSFYNQSSTIKDTSKRIKFILNNQEKWNHCMDAICDFRNQFVHKGRFPDEGLDQVGLIKYVVENVINFLLSMKQTFKSSHELEIYFQHGSLNSTDLRRRKKVISKILSLRK